MIKGREEEIKGRNDRNACERKGEKECERNGCERNGCERKGRKHTRDGHFLSHKPTSGSHTATPAL